MKIIYEPGNVELSDANKKLIKEKLLASLGGLLESTDIVQIRVKKSNKKGSSFFVKIAVKAQDINYAMLNSENENFETAVILAAKKIERYVIKERQRQRYGDEDLYIVIPERHEQESYPDEEIWQLPIMTKDEAKIQMEAYERNFFLYKGENGLTQLIYRKKNGKLRFASVY